MQHRLILKPIIGHDSVPVPSPIMDSVRNFFFSGRDGAARKFAYKLLFKQLVLSCFPGNATNNL
jgi:hypothetical protein